MWKELGKKFSKMVIGGMSCNDRVLVSAGFNLDNQRGQGYETTLPRSLAPVVEWLAVAFFSSLIRVSLTPRPSDHEKKGQIIITIKYCCLLLVICGAHKLQLIFFFSPFLCFHKQVFGWER